MRLEVRNHLIAMTPRHRLPRFQVDQLKAKVWQVASIRQLQLRFEEGRFVLFDRNAMPPPEGKTGLVECSVLFRSERLDVSTEPGG